MPDRDPDDFSGLIREAALRPTEGWDFSWLGARFRSSPLPWDFVGLASERASRAETMLDMGTGGGEWLAALPTRPPRTVATEGWPPNVPVARARLAPLGVEVVEVVGAPDNVRQAGGDEDGGELPFEEATFDLILNRHESFLAREVARALRPGGIFLTQQLGDGVYAAFHELLAATPSRRPRWCLALAVAQMERAGLALVGFGEGEQLITFDDVGALVWYLRMIPWTVPEFSIARYESRLRELHAVVERDGPLTVSLPGFYLEAVK